MSILDPPLAREATRRILDVLAQGPRPVNELPHRWPVTRSLVRACVAELAARGDVRLEGGGSRRRVHRVTGTRSHGAPHRHAA